MVKPSLAVALPPMRARQRERVRLYIPPLMMAVPPPPTPEELARDEEEHEPFEARSSPVWLPSPTGFGEFQD